MEKLYGDLDRVVGELQEVVRTSTPESVSGDQARRFVERFAEAERASASGVALFTPVVVARGSFAKKGHASAQRVAGQGVGFLFGCGQGTPGRGRNAQPPIPPSPMPCTRVGCRRPSSRS